MQDRAESELELRLKQDRSEGGTLSLASPRSGY